MTSDFYSAYRDARRKRLYDKKFDESKHPRSTDGTFASKAGGAIKKAAEDLAVSGLEALPKILQGMMGPAMASSVERAIESDTPTAKVRVKKSDYTTAVPMSLKHGWKSPGHFIGAAARLKKAGDSFEYYGHVPARKPNEPDKQYAKRALESLPQPNNLPEIHAHYFNTEKADKSVSLEKLSAVRARKKGVANAPRYMRMTLEGLSTRRDPLDVNDNGDGTYTIVDGNSTYAAMKKYGWEQAPVRIVNKKSQGDIRKMQDKWDYAKRSDWDEDKHPRDEGGKFSGVSSKGSKATDPGDRSAKDVLYKVRKFRFLDVKDATKNTVTQIRMDEILEEKFPVQVDSVSALKPLSIQFPKDKKVSQSKQWVFKGQCCETDSDGNLLENEDGTPKVTQEFLKAGELLRQEAKTVQPEFLNAMSQGVARVIQGDTRRTKLHVFDSGKNFEKGKAAVEKYPNHPHVMVGGVKGMKRAAEKAASKGLSDDRPNWSSVTDFVRGTITAPTVTDLRIAVMRTNRAMQQNGFDQVYFRDRFNKPMPTGYSDIQMIYRHKKTGHMCELLATTSAMWLAKEVVPTSAGSGGHALYEKSRSIEDSTKSQKQDYKTEDANRLVELTAEQVKVYGDGLEESMSSPTLYSNQGPD